ncbi:NepR family anti-sigma factor [Vannielia sp.]|uniref:NepR family anti-sigma factor n=1 Tax=Vannielia sp. TaxID=2813045 RepID=UPI002607AB9E|nr:NepR family anti-sigma factor [Vannielia sp.]MDF1872499.1 NepR family anti-sigma factor [Vannielia sp.]
MSEQNNEPNEGLRRQIDENLRRVYQSQVEEELPDRFTDLLAKLKAQDSNCGSSE